MYKANDKDGVLGANLKNHFESSNQTHLMIIAVLYILLLFEGLSF